MLTAKPSVLDAEVVQVCGDGWHGADVVAQTSAGQPGSCARHACTAGQNSGPKEHPHLKPKLALKPVEEQHRVL